MSKVTVSTYIITRGATNKQRRLVIEGGNEMDSDVATVIIGDERADVDIDELERLVAAVSACRR